MSEKKVVFVITLLTGEYDSMWRSNLFVTDMEYKAKFYCSKANAMITKYRTYYDDLRNNLPSERFDNDYGHISDRCDFVNGIFSYHEMPIRTNIKINHLSLTKTTTP